MNQSEWITTLIEDACLSTVNFPGFQWFIFQKDSPKKYLLFPKQKKHSAHRHQPPILHAQHLPMDPYSTQRPSTLSESMFFSQWEAPTQSRIRSTPSPGRKSQKNHSTLRCLSQYTTGKVPYHRWPLGLGRRSLLLCSWILSQPQHLQPIGSSHLTPQWYMDRLLHVVPAESLLYPHHWPRRGWVPAHLLAHGLHRQYQTVFA